MQNEQKKLILSDLIDINFLQKLQDVFAKTMDVASLTVDENGPITKPSNFTNFCTNQIRSTKLGAKKCNECDIEGGKLALEKGEPIIYTCHTGLTHFVVPIIVAGQHIASILGGQISLSKPDEEHFKNVAKEFNIKDEKKYFKDLEKIKVVPEKKIKAAVKLLSLVANSISEIAHKNYQLIEKNHREKLIEKVIIKVRSTLEEEEIKKFFVEVVSNYFEVDRCLFVDYDPITGKFLPFKLEKLKNPKIKSIAGHDVEAEFPEFCKKLKEKKRNIIIKDVAKTLARKNLLGYRALQSLNQSEAKSDYGLIVWYKDQIIGILILHFLDKKRILTQDEFDFLKVLRDNAGTAIYQAKLYKKQKDTAAREIILRNIISQISGSLDIKVIQHEIVNQIGMFFNADGVRIADYDYIIQDYTVSGEAEYRASNNVKSMVGTKFKEIPGFNEYIRDVHFEGKDIIFNDLEAYLDKAKIRGTGVENFYREFGFISSVAVNIYHGNNYLGDFVLTFNNKRDFSNDEINFLKTLADQAGVALSQAKLHLKTVEQREKEALLRKITETIRKTLDINETKKTIVTEVYNALNADRVYIVEFDSKTDIPQILDKDSECISLGLKSLVGYNFASSEVDFLANIYRQNQPLITSNIEEFIIENNLQNTDLEKWIKMAEIKSGVGMPMIYGDKNFGVLCVNYTKSAYPITEEYIEFIKVLADQAGIALYQAELHSITEKQAEREKALRTITNIVRNSLDINEIKNKFVMETAKYFNANRCFIYELRKNIKSGIYAEYTSSPKVKKMSRADFTTAAFKYWEEIMFNQDILTGTLCEDLEQELIDNNLQGTPIDAHRIEYNIKTAIGVPIMYANQLYGELIIQYTDDIKKLNKEDLIFLRILAEQAAIALNQAELHSITKEQAERERIIREIISEISSTLDFNEIRKIFVNKLGNFLDSDFDILYIQDAKSKKFTQIDEYSVHLSSNEIESPIGINLVEEYGWGDFFRGGKMTDIVYSDIEDFKKDYNLYGTIGEKFIDKYKIKSTIVVPVKCANNLLGILGINFTKKYKTITDEDVKLVKTVAKQAGIAINQAELYQKTLEQGEREKVLREIINQIRSSLDFEAIKHEIVNQIGKLFKADRVVVAYYDYKINNYVITKKSEYTSSKDIKTFVDVNFTSIPGFAEYIREAHFKGRDIIFDDLDKYLDEKNLKNTGVESFYKDFGFASSAAINIYYKDTFLGDLVVTYENPRDITNEEIEFLKILSDQVGVAFHQAELYSTIMKQAERETLLRTITSTIRTSLNLEETFDIICSEIAKISGANRVAITEMVEENENNIIRGEFKSSENIKSARDLKADRANVFTYLITYLFSKNEPLILNNIEESDVPEFIKDFYRNLDVKSATIFPIKKGKDKWGILTISYVNEYKFWNESEISLLETILEQIYIAIKQAEIYDKTLLMARRETLIRNITEKIRSSLNIDETLTYICEESAKLFNVQRSSIISFPDKKDYMIFELKKEYKLSTNISGYTNISDINNIAEYWGRILTTVDKIMAIDNIEESDAPDYFKNSYTQMGVKSIIGTLISNSDDIWGILILSEYNKYRTWTNEERDLLKTISQQIYIAINQAELYESEKIMLERERISRNIIEILRSSIDKTIIKKLFVKNIGKFFNADRVFFSEYEPEKKIYLPVDKDSEYLSNISEKSFVGYDWSNTEIAEHIQPLLERREIKILDWEEYVQQHPNMSEGFRALYEDSNVKSSYNFPVLYQDRIIGYFCLEFTEKVCRLCEEDIGRIRSICTQAGIALHHAELYLKAQEYLLSRESILSDFFEKVKNPTNNILETSILLYENEFERPMQIDYLNNIISSCNQLLELTKDIEIT